MSKIAKWGVGIVALLVVIIVALIKTRTIPIVLSGASIPDFEVMSLQGDIVRSSDLRGQPMVLILGATWCPHCRKEVVEFQKVYAAHADELTVLFVGIDKEDNDKLTEFGAEFGLTFPITSDEFSTASRYFGPFIPNIYFIDAAGVVRSHSFSELKEGQLENSLASIGITN